VQAVLRQTLTSQQEPSPRLRARRGDTVYPDARPILEERESPDIGVTHVPAGTPDQDVAEVRKREAAVSAGGNLMLLLRPATGAGRMAHPGSLSARTTLIIWKRPRLRVT